LDSDVSYRWWINRKIKYFEVEGRNNVFWSQDAVLRSWYLTYGSRIYLENRFSADIAYNNEYKLLDKDYLYQVYLEADPDFTGRVTVPILWDKQRHTIVSNESSEIIRMLNSSFDDLGANTGDYYPEAHRQTIDDTTFDTAHPDADRAPL